MCQCAGPSAEPTTEPPTAEPTVPTSEPTAMPTSYSYGYATDAPTAVTYCSGTEYADGQSCANDAQWPSCGGYETDSRRRGRAEGGSFPFPQTGRGARRRRSRAPFPSSPEHDYAACRPSKGRLHES